MVNKQEISHSSICWHRNGCDCGVGLMRSRARHDGWCATGNSDGLNGVHGRSHGVGSIGRGSIAVLVVASQVLMSLMVVAGLANDGQSRNESDRDLAGHFEF